MNVINKGFSVVDDLELAECFGNSGFGFVRTESIKECAKLNVSLKANDPADSTMGMLVHLEPELHRIGY